MPENPCDCNFKICYCVTNGVTSELGSVFLTISVILLSKFIIHQMFSHARDLSKRVTWANIPQLKLENILGYF